MSLQARRFPTATFAFVLFCFLLPFATVACPGGQFTFSGLQMATGTTIDEPQMFGQAKKREIDGEPLALLAALCTLGGLLLSLLPGSTMRRLTGAAGVAGAVLLLLLKAKVEKDVMTETSGMLQVSFGVGFWLALLGFAAAAALAFLLARQGAPAPALVQEQPPSPDAAPGIPEGS